MSEELGTIPKLNSLLSLRLVCCFSTTFAIDLEIRFLQQTKEKSILGED